MFQIDAGVLIRLRAATRPAHNSVEAALAFLVQPLNLNTYKSAIERFYGFWLGWEPQIAVLLHDEALSEPRRRLHMLAADLAGLGMSVDAIKVLPRCPLTTLYDEMEALGSLYVMEGSTLGGRIIEQNLLRCFGESAPAIGHYFNGYGAATGTMWRSFLARLAKESVTDADRMGAGALKTFERLDSWFTDETPDGGGGGVRHRWGDARAHSVAPAPITNITS
jgi:heme oxygenase (biliverdin-IX-beta and delta-forming)